MNADDFVSLVRQNVPGAFRISRKHSDSVIGDRHVIRELIECYDMASCEIGLVTFGRKIETLSQMQVFGNVEADLLAIDEKQDGKVVMLDHAAPDHIMCDVALSDATFLDAMAEFALRVYKDQIDVGSQEEVDLAYRCGELAGGESFTPFYQMLLGVAE